MTRPPAGYRGRFAPSPTGPLHAGSLVAALASWLDARAHHGAWRVRIEDVDLGRCVPGADREILRQLAALGLVGDAEPVWQSAHGERYQQALDHLVSASLAYPCACTRKDIAQALAAQGWAHERHVERPYPGTCRPELGGLRGRPGRAWRLHVPACLRATHTPSPLVWHDRRLGPQAQDVADTVGDFVLRRADGLWAYQLAVVVDDADQGITHVVRGADLTDNTPRQILLQRALGLPTPQYLHTPLVLGTDGEKLSKQHGAPALDVSAPLTALNTAAQVLGLPAQHGPLDQALATWTGHWAQTWAVPHRPA
ncbi:tRNA glutamyl-Q(34) synthetase GluQRS [Macromonas nakdongensis]|uniref:tRNA glutamyl-Q(34) synthetase GluQRS n=1 Tax=Macromonas nakdongensis TaxID=1843082 RepID=UPI000C3243EA|nr:tRNA glutamyl-Q(34) synthetase GluQRS [Macromonas nakdongensis]